MKIKINPKGREGKKILENLLDLLEPEKPILMGELEDRMVLSIKKKKRYLHPNMFERYRRIYELMLCIAIANNLVSIKYFCRSDCTFATYTHSKDAERACYMLTENGV